MTIIRTDNGTEFNNNIIRQFLLDHNIHHEHTAPYSPQQNSVAESAIRDLKRCAYTMLLDSNLANTYGSLWGEALIYAGYLSNFIPCLGNDFHSPNNVANLNNQHEPTFIFGSISYVKEGDNINKALFVGKSKNSGHNTMRFLKLDTLRLVDSTHYKMPLVP